MNSSEHLKVRRPYLNEVFIWFPRDLTDLERLQVNECVFTALYKRFPDEPDLGIYKGDMDKNLLETINSKQST